MMIDDFSAQSLAAYGGLGTYDTPNIDRLAEEGLVFEHAHSMPMCGPSRGTLLSGKHLFRHGTAPEETPFIGNLLQGAGYKTAIIGKWMVQSSKPDPIGRGFDEAALWVNGYRYWDIPIVVWNSGGMFRDINQPTSAPLENEWNTPTGPEAGQATILKGTYGPEQMSLYACDFIERHRDEPFFLYYPLKLPHSPQMPTPDSKDITEAEKMIEHDYTKMRQYPKSGNRGAEFFADNIAYVDKILGRILDTLDAQNIRENTLLIFTSDNGRKGDAVEPGVRRIPGGKGTPLDGATRVPFIASWPSVVASGTRCPDMIHFVDVLPTLVEAAGGTLPEGEPYDGISFLPQIKGQSGTPREWVYFHGGNHENPTSAALKSVVSYDATQAGLRKVILRWVRGERYKLYNDGRLHDLETDYTEQAPIAPGTDSLEAEVARAKLQAVLDTYGDRSQWQNDTQLSEPVHEW